MMKRSDSLRATMRRPQAHRVQNHNWMFSRDPARITTIAL